MVQSDEVQGEAQSDHLMVERELTDFEKSLLGEYPMIKHYPVIVYRDVANVWVCRLCPSVTFHLYSDGVGRCIGCGLAADAFVVAHQTAEAAGTTSGDRKSSPPDEETA